MYRLLYQYLLSDNTYMNYILLLQKSECDLFLTKTSSNYRRLPYYIYVIILFLYNIYLYLQTLCLCIYYHQARINIIPKRVFFRYKIS